MTEQFPLPKTQKQVVIYDLEDGSTLRVEKIAQGWFRGETEKFDFVRDRPERMYDTLRAWGATLAGYETK